MDIMDISLLTEPTDTLTLIREVKARDDSPERLVNPLILAMLGKEGDYGDTPWIPTPEETREIRDWIPSKEIDPDKVLAWLMMDEKLGDVKRPRWQDPDNPEPVEVKQDKGEYYKGRREGRGPAVLSSDIDPHTGYVKHDDLVIHKHQPQRSAWTDRAILEIDRTGARGAIPAAFPFSDYDLIAVR